MQLRSAELGAVTGTVAGQGAGVMVYLAGTSFLALTDAEGDFAITRVPAGDYQAVASLNGIHSPPQAVTVKAGEATAVAGALDLAPAITGVTPNNVVRIPYWGGDGHTASIQGRRFGATQGASRLYYYDVEVPQHAITGWSDDEITVDFGELRRWYDALDAYGLLVPLDYDRMKFRVETLAGSVTSGITGYFISEFDARQVGERYQLLFMIHPLAVEEGAGLPLSVNVTNGHLVDSEGRAVTTPVSAQYGDWGSAYFVAPDTDLPLLFTYAVDDPRFDTTPTKTYSLERVDPIVSSYVYPGPTGEITGDLTRWDASLGSEVPFSDYGDFTFQYAGYPESEATPVFQPNGSFTVFMPIRAEHFDSEIDLLVLYQGVEVGYDTLFAP